MVTPRWSQRQDSITDDVTISSCWSTREDRIPLELGGSSGDRDGGLREDLSFGELRGLFGDVRIGNAPDGVVGRAFFNAVTTLKPRRQPPANPRSRCAATRS